MTLVLFQTERWKQPFPPPNDPCACRGYQDKERARQLGPLNFSCGDLNGGPLPFLSFIPPHRCRLPPSDPGYPVRTGFATPIYVKLSWEALWRLCVPRIFLLANSSDFSYVSRGLLRTRHLHPLLGGLDVVAACIIRGGTPLEFSVLAFLPPLFLYSWTVDTESLFPRDVERVYPDNSDHLQSG